jgi:hypothetical protein
VEPLVADGLPLVGVAAVSSRGSVVVPVKAPPPLSDTLTRMSLLQAPTVLTPVYSGVPVSSEKPCGTQPFASLECLLM